MGKKPKLRFVQRMTSVEYGALWAGKYDRLTRMTDDEYRKMWEGKSEKIDCFSEEDMEK